MKAWQLSIIFKLKSPKQAAYFSAWRLLLIDENIAANESGGV